MSLVIEIENEMQLDTFRAGDLTYEMARMDLSGMLVVSNLACER